MGKSGRHGENGKEYVVCAPPSVNVALDEWDGNLPAGAPFIVTYNELYESYTYERMLPHV